MATKDGPKTELEKCAINRFREEVCKRAKEVDPDDEFDWTDLSVGFFLACGLTDIERVNELAAWARYQVGYWQTEDLLGRD